MTLTYETLREEIAESHESASQFLNNFFAPCAWPGGYPLLFLDKDNSILCHKCAKHTLLIDHEPIDSSIEEEPSWSFPWGLYCEECGEEIIEPLDPNDPDWYDILTKVKGYSHEEAIDYISRAPARATKSTTDNLKEDSSQKELGL